MVLGVLCSDVRTVSRLLFLFSAHEAKRFFVFCFVVLRLSEMVFQGYHTWVLLTFTLTGKSQAGSLWEGNPNQAVFPYNKPDLSRPLPINTILAAHRCHRWL